MTGEKNASSSRATTKMVAACAADNPQNVV
jgi:hypothetical protein